LSAYDRLDVVALAAGGGAPGWEFDHWEVNGRPTTTGVLASVIMTKDQKAVAFYRRKR